MSSDSDVKSRLKALYVLINDHSHKYHALDAPIVSDAEYDLLFQELLSIENSNPQFIDKNSPSQRVGSKPLEGFKKITHLEQMLSLDNAFDGNDLQDFDKRITERLNIDECIEYSCEPKLDGVAASLLYRSGELDYASTRGDGKVGEDITHNIRTIQSVPLKLNNNKSFDIPELLEVRGEVFIELKDFEEINKHSKKNGLKNLVRATCGTGYSSELVRKHAPYDLILCNILANPLVKMAGDLSRHLDHNPKRRQFIILSGLLEHDGNRVIAAHRSRGLHLYNKIKINGWVVLVMTH